MEKSIEERMLLFASIWDTSGRDDYGIGGGGNRPPEPPPPDDPSPELSPEESYYSDPANPGSITSTVFTPEDDADLRTFLAETIRTIDADEAADADLVAGSNEGSYVETTEDVYGIASSAPSYRDDQARRDQLRAIAALTNAGVPFEVTPNGSIYVPGRGFVSSVSPTVPGYPASSIPTYELPNGTIVVTARPYVPSPRNNGLVLDVGLFRSSFGSAGESSDPNLIRIGVLEGLEDEIVDFLSGLHSYHLNSIVAFLDDRTTPSEVFAALRMQWVPGIPFDNRFMVTDGHVSNASALGLPLGRIITRVYPDRMMIINFTRPDHTLAPGFVVRRVVSGPAGYYIRTDGYGAGLLPTINQAASWSTWARSTINIRDLVNLDRFNESTLPGN